MNIRIFICAAIVGIPLGFLFRSIFSRLERLVDAIAKNASAVSEAKAAMELIAIRTNAKMDELDAKFAHLSERIKKLEDGATPDYEEMKKAKEETDKFYAGLSAILGYDQKEAVRRQKKGSDE